MTNNPTIDGVSRELIETLHHMGFTHSFITPAITKQLRALLDAPAVEPFNDLREHCKQCAEVVKTWPEWKQNCLGGAPGVERQEPMPSQVPVLRAMAANYRDGHSWDFLDGEAVSKAADEITRLQSTIARIAELEIGRGEPVAEVEHGPFDDVGAPQWVRVVTLGDYDLEHIPDGTKLYTAPPAPVPLTDSFVQPVPDKCDRITWRGSYYHLPPAPVAAVADERAEFVNWVRRDWPQAPLSLIRDLLPKDDPHYGEYCDERLQRAWVGWQARACLDATAALNGERK